MAAPAPAAVDAMKVDDEEIGEVELTEEDFQDPALMAEVWTSALARLHACNIVYAREWCKRRVVRGQLVQPRELV